MNSDKPRILVVDDVLENIEILNEMLQTDYEVTMAMNGAKALKLAESESPPDLILLDVMMPDMDGHEVCRRLKQNPLTKKIPVIFVTAREDAIDEVKGLELGAVDYLTKPINPAIVKARVKTHLHLTAAVEGLEKQNEILQGNIQLLEQIEQIARHDLKGPLTLFMNVSDYMERGKNLTPDQLKFLKMLDKSALKMLGMIDRSLDLFKMERGQYQVSPVPVDMVELVRLTFRELEGLAEARTVECFALLNGHVLSDLDSCMVSGEANLVSTIVSNLVKNAIEASPEGERVVLEMIDQDPFVLLIKNQGGIPPEIQARFLERYVTSGKRGGTGLGGYSARLMTKTMGGEIRFVSNQETGTVITVSIPHAPSPQPVRPQEPRKRDSVIVPPEGSSN
jgi:two-component system sensor histidine kinase/response regulator